MSGQSSLFATIARSLQFNAYLINDISQIEIYVYLPDKFLQHKNARCCKENRLGIGLYFGSVQIH